MPKLLNFRFPERWYFFNFDNAELKRSSKTFFSVSERHRWAVVGYPNIRENRTLDVRQFFFGGGCFIVTSIQFGFDTFSLDFALKLGKFYSSLHQFENHFASIVLALETLFSHIAELSLSKTQDLGELKSRVERVPVQRREAPIRPKACFATIHYSFQCYNKSISYPLQPTSEHLNEP